MHMTLFFGLNLLVEKSTIDIKLGKKNWFFHLVSLVFFQCCECAEWYAKHEKIVVYLNPLERWKICWFQFAIHFSTLPHCVLNIFYQIKYYKKYFYLCDVRIWIKKILKKNGFCIGISNPREINEKKTNSWKTMWTARVKRIVWIKLLLWTI